jgi:isocitrate/isopropylmalate dehydrogenase
MVEIGVIGGDGIGPEVVRAGMRVLEGVASDDPSLELGFTEFPWGCEYYLGLLTTISFLSVAVLRPTPESHDANLRSCRASPKCTISRPTSENSVKRKFTPA